MKGNLSGSTLFSMTKTIYSERNIFFGVDIISCHPYVYTMDHLKPKGRIHKGIHGLSMGLTSVSKSNSPDLGETPCADSRGGGVRTPSEKSQKI